MSELLKIGVIYRDTQPQILADAIQGTTPWQFQFFSESGILHTPVAPHSDFPAVFCPCDASDVLRNHVSRMFPGARIIPYREDIGEPCADSGTQTPESMAVRLPMHSALAHHLLDSLALVHSGRREEARVRSRSEDFKTVLDGFVGLMESAWRPSERKQAMTLWLRELIGKMGAEECLLYTCSGAGPDLARFCETGNIRELDLFEQQANRAIVQQVFHSGDVLVDNQFSFEIRVPFQGESQFIRSMLCYPLYHRGEKVGVIEILNRSSGAFTEEDRSLVELSARPIAVALKSMHIYDQAEQLTITDDLTKLFNYRYLKQYLEAEVKRCLRYKKRVSLLFIDVDGFKRVNDTFGHLVGSLALAEIGQLLRRILRETDVIGRYGGDEFIVVLPETPLTGALVIGERIRKKIEDYNFIAQDLTIRLTVSLGISNCPKHTLTAEGLIKKADAAMYRAKELSKNNVKVAV